MSAASGIASATIALSAVAALDVVWIDWRTQKIPNRHLKFFFLAAAGCYAAAAAVSGPYGTAFFRSAALHAAVGLASGIGLWRAGMWPAGDAKLFWLLALLLPLVDPGNPNLPARLSLVCLINVFVPAAVYVVLRAVGWLWATRLKFKVLFLGDLGLRRLPDYLVKAHAEAVRAAGTLLAEIGRRARERPAAAAASVGDAAAMTLLGSACTLHFARVFDLGWLNGPLIGFAAFLLLDFFRDAFGRAALWLSAAGLLVLAFYRAWPAPVAEVLGMWMTWALFMSCMNAGMFAMKVLFQSGEPFMPLLWMAGALVPMGLSLAKRRLHDSAAGGLGWIFWGAVFGIGYLFVAHCLDQDVLYLLPEKIHEGLVLAPATVRALRDDERTRERFARLYPDGITAGQVDALREWTAGRPLEEIAFRRTMPFAAWIFAGAWLTMALRGDILSRLLRSGLRVEG